MAFSISPILGAAVSINGGLVGTKGYWDALGPGISPMLGTMVKGSDGHDYLLAKASGAIASGARAALTEPAMTMATDVSGAWVSPTVEGGTPIDQIAWFKRYAI